MIIGIKDSRHKSKCTSNGSVSHTDAALEKAFVEHNNNLQYKHISGRFFMIQTVSLKNINPLKFSYRFGQTIGHQRAPNRTMDTSQTKTKQAHKTSEIFRKRLAVFFLFPYFLIWRLDPVG